MSTATEIIDPILRWLNAHPHLAGIATFVISTSESVAIIGTIVPGSIMMTAIGALAGADIIPLWPTLIWAILGAILGDGISYWLGYYFRDRLLCMWPFTRYPSLLIKGKKFVYRYGGMSVFIGRFIGPVRALVPLVAGMLGMKPASFTVFNITSAIAWAPLYMLPGLLLGAAALELPPDIAIHVMLVLLLLALSGLLCLWILRQLVLLIRQRIAHGLILIWQGLKQFPCLRRLTLLLQHYDTAIEYGQLPLVFYFLICIILLLTLISLVIEYPSSSISINNTLYYLFRGLRHAVNGDSLMLGLTMLGEKTVILPIMLMVCLWLALQSCWRAAYHFWAIAILGVGSIAGLKLMIQSSRPLGIVQNRLALQLHDYSMPSGHTALIALCLGGIIFFSNIFLTSSLLRRILNSIFVFVVVGVSASRLYLGAHWLTDIVGAWLLSGVLLIPMMISYRRKLPDPIASGKLLMMSSAIFIITYSYVYYQKIEVLRTHYAMISLPKKQITLRTWWEQNILPSTYRTNLFGFPSQWINLEWLGSLRAIKTTLLEAGWVPPPQRDWLSILYRLTGGVQSTKYIALISPHYLDHPPRLILTRLLNDHRTLLVLRLWDADVRMMPMMTCCLWVGVVNMETSTYSWLYKKHPGQVNIDYALLFPHIQQSIWQFKLILKERITENKRFVGKQLILLIAPSILNI